MTCADARHLILTGDLSAVRAEMDPSLREHFAGCATCAAEASWIVGDTARLRSALRARGPQPVARWPRNRRIAVSLIPLALAAEITLLAFLANRDAQPLATPRRLDDSVYSTAPMNLVRHDSDMVMGVARAPSRKAAAVAPDTQAKPRTASMNADDRSMSQVRVTVNDNQRAAIFTTSNPKITVVLFARGDSL